METRAKEKLKRHSLTDIIRGMFGRHRIGREGSVLALFPMVDTEDIIVVTKDNVISVSMYKKPNPAGDWKLTDLYKPVIFKSSQVLSEIPEEIRVEGDQVVSRFSDGVTVTAPVNRNPSESVVAEAESAIKAIPDKMETTLEATRFVTNNYTDSISSHDNKVVVGNEFIAVKYDSTRTGSVRIKSKFVIDVIRTIARQTRNGEIGIASNDKNIVISTNTGPTTEQSDEVNTYIISANYSQSSGRTPEEVIKSTEAIINSGDANIVISSKTIVSGFIKSLKSVLTKYSNGLSNTIMIEISKDSIYFNIKDSSVNIEKELDLSSSDVMINKNITYPYIMPVKTNVARYLLDLDDSVKEIKEIESGKRKIIVLTTESESAIFAA